MNGYFRKQVKPTYKVQSASVRYYLPVYGYRYRITRYEIKITDRTIFYGEQSN
jgi:hypothetical protein